VARLPRRWPGIPVFRLVEASCPSTTFRAHVACMTANDDVSQFTDLLASELHTAQDRWSKAMAQVEAELASKGRFESGARIAKVAECLNDGLILFGRFIFEKWTAYIRPRLASQSAAGQMAFVDAALGQFDRAVADAIARFEARPSTPPHPMANFSGSVKETGARTRRSLEAELRLYLSTPVDAPASTNVTVATHGSNSPVNVGSGTLNQQVNVTQGMAELVTALAGLLEAMRQGQDHQLDDVREIVVEAKDEATKPKPNRLRLRSVLAGIKTGIEGIAVLEKAWELVESAAHALDLTI
jgi:hypothetical protein